MLVDFLSYILEWAHALTDSYGWSIVLLSLIVTIILLPLYWIAEIIRLKEKEKRLRMEPDLAKLKDVSNRQEKYYYTRTIYRQHNYSPIYSLAGTLSLLVQVPFFLAAYWLLLDYPPLAGVSWGPIGDLAKADSLLKLGGTSINILPILMTMVNLLGVYAYSKDVEGNRERTQLVLVAILFLVLLYNLPSALVLYWTMNNILAPFKNYILSKAINPDQIAFVSRVGKVLKANAYFIYPLLLSLFPLQIFYLQNSGEVQFSQLLAPGLGVLFIFLVFITGMSLVFRDQSKVILFGLATVFLIFSFGHIHDYLFSILLNSPFLKKNISFRPTFLLWLLFVALIAYLFWKVFKTNKNLDFPSKIVKIFTICLSIVSVSWISYSAVFVKQPNYTPSELWKDGLQTSDFPSQSKTISRNPDIYYIILDAYANSQVLKKFHGFDNSEFENFLEQQGFFIAKDSRSNYLATFLSLAATLNFQYITNLKNILGESAVDKKIPYAMIHESKVVDFLNGKGYTTIHFDSGYPFTKRLQNVDFNISGISVLADDFLFSFLRTTVFYPIFKTIFKPVSEWRGNILHIFDKISKLNDFSSPKFVFAHILSPHVPYVFDANGNKPDSGPEFKLDNTFSKSEQKLYLNQLSYINKKVAEAIKEIRNNNKEAVIILQSDHGSAFSAEAWNVNSTEFLEERSKILNAVLLPGYGTELLYPKISSVNTFRVIFNTVFGESLELLGDSTYYSTYEKPYDFVNVTPILDQSTQ